MKKIVVILAVAGVMMASGLRAENTVFYVSTAGNDSWTGKLADPNKAKTDGPFATITKARDAVRDLKGDEDLKFPVSVQIRGGTYYLTEDLVFSPKDSGSKDFPITYQAYKNEKPVLSGGKLIKGWKKSSRIQDPGSSIQLWQADIPEAVSEGWNFHQLFVSGERRTRARSPNTGYFYVKRAGGGKVKNLFYYNDDDIKAWEGWKDALLTFYHSWETSLTRLTSIDTENKTAKIRDIPWGIGAFEKRQRYQVENVFEALDAPGEWFLDRREGTLYYYPMPGEDMAKVEVIAPLLVRTLVNFKGRPEGGKYIEFITFRDISFQYTDASIPRIGIPNSSQAAFNQEAAIMARGIRNCSFISCEMAHLGEYGIWLRQGCQDNTITRCEVRDMGAGGIRIGEGNNPPDAGSAVLRNVVDNNFVHDGCYIWHGAVGILVGRSSYNRISHNEISDMDYTGISVGWSWGYDPSSANNNIIEYNHIHHIVRSIMNDVGGIYTLGISPGTILRYNLIHDLHPYTTAMGALGIYLDEGSSDILVENNVVYNIQSSCFNHHYGKENMVYNNIFAFGVEGQVTMGRDEPHIHFFFERNIVYSRCGEIMSVRWFNGNLKADNNLYWDVSTPDPTFKNMHFDKWQGSGQDTHSVIADPLFVNPDNYDFRLKPGSPAEKIGFKPFDISPAGLYGDKEWTDKPKKLAHRPFVKPISPEQEAVEDDFEFTPVDSQPDAGHVYSEGRGSIVVTDGTAAGGKHSLKFTDASGQKNSYNPHFVYNTRFISGKMKFTFDMKQDTQVPADISVELRQWDGDPYKVGPSISVQPDGTFTANGNQLLAVPLGAWFKVEMEFELGEKGTKAYTLTLTPEKEKPQAFRDIDFGSQDFNVLTYIGFISNSTDRTVFYVDNIKLEPVK